ncbi:MAG: adenylyltransferase/cytidyltransferase family protein [Rhodobacteraceae bacterium]|nr:adenylyltransferase/cytidyltransferase family protein [Paracoccaceae bacterium]
MGKLVSASIHGRFQPFHNGHLQYFRWAKERADCIYVGITQIHNQHEADFPGAEHRGLIDNNPLTFFERFQVIETTLISEGFSLADFRIIPFPIEDPFRLSVFLPTSIKCFTTRHSEWNDHKVKLLEDAGFTTEILSDDEQHVQRTSGTEIRSMMKSGNLDWKRYIPEGSHDMLESTLCKKLTAAQLKSGR